MPKIPLKQGQSANISNTEKRYKNFITILIEKLLRKFNLFSHCH